MRKQWFVLSLIFGCSSIHAFQEDKSIYCPKDVSQSSISYHNKNYLILDIYNSEEVLFRSEPVLTQTFDDVLPSKFTGKYDYDPTEKKLGCEYLTWNENTIVAYNSGTY